MTGEKGGKFEKCRGPRHLHTEITQAYPQILGAAFIDIQGRSGLAQKQFLMNKN